MNSLFETKTLQDINNRIENLNKKTEPIWGKMNAGQMLKHCQVPFGFIDGSVVMKTKVGFLKKMIFKMMKSMMYNDKPWKHNVPTGKEFIITGNVDFDVEKENLVQIVTNFHKRKEHTDWKPHPIFGNFKKEQWGKMQYKHLDHHLRQFGV